MIENYTLTREYLSYPQAIEPEERKVVRLTLYKQGKYLMTYEANHGSEVFFWEYRAQAELLYHAHHYGWESKEVGDILCAGHV